MKEVKTNRSPDKNPRGTGEGALETTAAAEKSADSAAASGAEINNASGAEKIVSGAEINNASGAEKTASGAEGKAEISLAYRDKKEVIKGGVLGAFIGLAIIVPGVSGSAVAIIFRLYEKLLYALGNLFKKFRSCAKFLLPIVLGAIVGVGVGFLGVQKLLNVLPFAVVALFAGLMFGSYPAITDQLKGETRTKKRAILFIIGMLVPIALSIVTTFAKTGVRSLENLTVWHYLLFLVLGYAVAVTQLVPGLSATALLMIFGYFTPLMNSVSLTYWKENPSIFIVYVVLVVGFAAGIVTVSGMMSKLLEKRRAPAFYTIAGLSLGTALTMFLNPEIVAVYRSWSASGIRWWELGLGVVLFALGIYGAYQLVKVERKKG